MRVASALLVTMLLSALVGCAAPAGTDPNAAETAGSSTPTEPETTAPSQSAEADGWEWAAESPEEHSHALGEVAAEEGEPDGEALPGVGTEDPPQEVGEIPPEGEEVLDPCSLVLESEWSDWTGGADVSTVALEGGDACGWIGPGDELRMAIAVFAAAGDHRWLTSEETASAEPVDDLADQAWWLTGWPLAQSSTLVVEAGGVDLVIEMSAMEPDPDLLLDAARYFADLALGRLP